jgi:DNA polymerase-3 subunit chi
MERLDTLLWTFEATSFVAHRRVSGSGPQEANLDTPIWLMDEAGDGGEVSPVGFGDALAVNGPDVLLNLGDEAVRDPSPWQRIIEVVPIEPSARQRARQRWRDYESRGLTPVHRAVNDAAS